MMIVLIMMMMIVMIEVMTMVMVTFWEDLSHSQERGGQPNDACLEENDVVDILGLSIIKDQ